MALEDTMMVQPAAPLDHIKKLFEMPFDIVQLHRDGILGETFDEHTKTRAHADIILKPKGADWSKEAEAMAPEPPRLSKNDACYVRLAACFDKWDASGSGLLEIEEVAGVMSEFPMWPKLRAIVGSERLDKAELTALFRQLWAEDDVDTKRSILDALEKAVDAFAEQYPFKEAGFSSSNHIRVLLFALL